MTGYGIDYADAVELRAMILAGEEWHAAATTLSERCVAATERADPPASRATKRNLFHRASALLRMSQALMLRDDEQRRDIVRRSVDLYAKAVKHGLPREHVAIETPEGTLSGWWVEAAGSDAAGTVIVIGGVEGWAMDFDAMGDAFAERGLNTLLLDAPGQGESRIINRHFLTPDWKASFARAIDWCQDRAPGLPIGIVGNSMGGALTVALANQDSRISACVNNGGIIKPSFGRMAGETFFGKMIAFTGLEPSDGDKAAAIWDTIEPVKPGPNAGYPLLVIQGGSDPLVADDHGKLFMHNSPTQPKRMEHFSDGIHCIYNHMADRDAIIGDWLRARLSAAAKPSA